MLNGKINQVPELLAKFCTPTKHGKIQVREMCFSSSATIEEVLERARPHFPGVASMCIMYRNNDVDLDKEFRSLLEEKKNLTIQLTLEDGSTQEVPINGGLKISQGPGFGTTIEFFKWCAMALGAALMVWHYAKPDKGDDPLYEKYTRESQLQQELGGIDEEMAQTIIAERIAQEELDRGIIWRAMETDQKSQDLVETLPW